jgi:mono/diheme cytochrome c family protein
MLSQYTRSSVPSAHLVGRLLHALFLLCGIARGVSAELKWESLTNKCEAKQGQTNAIVVFHLTNVSTRPITIEAVRPSCHCTVAKVPAQPWIIKPGEATQLEVDVELSTKWGAFTKTISVETRTETNLLTIFVNVPEPDMRGKNQVVAFTDRQAVFKGDCASCHLQPALGKMGAELYRSICSICHEAEHRAEMVPDLAHLKVPTDAKFWEQSLRIGKPGTLMPAFSKPFGGPLTTEQIQSLVTYLTERFPQTAHLAAP